MQSLITPVARIITDFDEKFGVPRQSGRVKTALGKIIFEPEFRAEDALRGIEQYSHLWLIFGFSLTEDKPFSPLVRPPRLGGNEKVGVFASRSPNRPNRLGLSVVKLEGVKNSPQGKILLVSGVDLVSGTPIYDVKPYLPDYDCVTEAKGGFSSDCKDYRLTVELDCAVPENFPQDKIETLKNCLADDPRPSYHKSGREYGMKFCGFNVKFRSNNGALVVTEITEL